MSRTLALGSVGFLLACVNVEAGLSAGPGVSIDGGVISVREVSLAAGPGVFLDGGSVGVKFGTGADEVPRGDLVALKTEVPTPTQLNADFASKTHTHTISQITDVDAEAEWPGTVAAARITSAGGKTFEQRLTELEAKVTSLGAGLCPQIGLPSGEVVRYERDESVTNAIVCTATVAGANAPVDGWVDHLVRVGDFWIDRYEASTTNDGTPGGNSGGNTTQVAISQVGATPVVNRTWFQAQQTCANAGKRLCTNAEWQLAASGTPDVGVSDGTAGTCRTSGPGIRKAALGTACRSRFGAEDLVGNVWEWVADWGQAGNASATYVDGAVTQPWPSEYGPDGVWGVNGKVSNGATNYAASPAATRRGGGWDDGAQAGVFAYALQTGPAGANDRTGFRCCVSR